MNEGRRKIILVVLLAGIAGIIIYLESGKNKEEAPLDGSDSELAVMNKEEKTKLYEPAKEISTPDAFINTPPITIADLIGKKVVLVDFWTYSCINCQRTIPYLNQWHQKYADDGLLIIGIHTPEFEFEKKLENVQKAVEQFGIKYPIVLDNDFSTWRAYENRYWPRKYLIDIDGFIVYDHIGEGGYEETEEKIQKLLEERKTALGMNKEINKDISTSTEIVGVDSAKLRSPEIYFGSKRNEYLGNGVKNKIGIQKFGEPRFEKENILYLVGTWDIQPEFSENKNSGARIIFTYKAKNVYFVAGSENGTKIKIIKDGKLVGEQVINAHQLYDIIKDQEYGEHTLEIIIENPGLRAFTFTFG